MAFSLAWAHVKCVSVRGGFSFPIGSTVSLARERACVRVQAGRQAGSCHVAVLSAAALPSVSNAVGTHPVEPVEQFFACITLPT